MCSSDRARLNALRGFFHTQFVEEISTKYSQFAGCPEALYPVTHHKAPIGKIRR